MQSKKGSWRQFLLEKIGSVIICSWRVNLNKIFEESGM